MSYNTTLSGCNDHDWDDWRSIAGKPDPVSILGCYLFTILSMSWFMGILSSQCTTYYRSFKQDNQYVRTFVFSLVILSIAQWASVFARGWNHYVIHNMNWRISPDVPWYQCLEPIIAQLTVLLCHLFLAHRYWKLSGHKWVSLVLVLVSIACMVIFTIVASRMMFEPLQLYNMAFTPVILAMFFNLATDCAVTGLTIHKLVTSRRGLNPNTDSLLNQLAALTLEAAVPPSLSALLQIISFVIARDNSGGARLLFNFFNILIARLYVSSALYIVNSRYIMRQAMYEQDGIHRNLLPRWFYCGRPKSQSSKAISSPVQFATMASSSNRSSGHSSQTPAATEFPIEYPMKCRLKGDESAWTSTAEVDSRVGYAV